MNIEAGAVVTFHYTLRDSKGVALETSDDGEPTAYLHESNSIIPGLKKTMAGHKKGDTFSVTVNPKEAYGERQEGKTQRVPIKHLIFKDRLRAGDKAQLNTREGRRVGTRRISIPTTPWQGTRQFLKLKSMRYVPLRQKS